MKMPGATRRPIKKKCMTELATQVGMPTLDGMSRGGRLVSGS